MSAATIAQLKITLDDIKPVVLRRIEVPLILRLDRLHLAFQAAMGWTNSHLYEIRAGGVGWSTPYPDADWAGDFIDARKARLEDIGTKSLQYLYDFGDGWEHTIKIERLIDPEPGILYPRLIEAKGHCPPEDVGGPWGYGEFLENDRPVQEVRPWTGPALALVDCRVEGEDTAMRAAEIQAFGFVEGSDIGDKGERELESDTTIRAGKSTGSFADTAMEFQFSYSS